MNNVRHVIASIAIATLSIGLALAAQPDLYRPGQREVLEPPTQTARIDAGVIALFESRYKSAGSPRVAVFWNRALSPELTDRASVTATLRDEESETLRERNSGGAVDAGKTTANVDATWTGERTKRLSISGPARDEQSRNLMREPDDWAVETMFLQTMTDAGARLIDRSTVLRLTQFRDRAGDEANRKMLEMAALSKHADLLLEVLVTPDHRAFSGWGFRVQVKDLRDGTLVASLYTEAKPAAANAVAFRATDRGFERVSVEPKRVDVGRELAVQVMAEMTKRLH